MVQLVGVDRLIIGVRDLDDAAAAWGRLGFQVSPEFRYAPWGHRARVVNFGLDRIELWRPEGVAGRDGPADRDGPVGLSYLVSGSGGEPDGASTVAVTLSGPDFDAAPASFPTTHLPEGVLQPSGFLTDEAVLGIFPRSWARHPNGARRLLSLSLAVPDPRVAVRPLVALGAPSAIDTDGVTVTLGPTSIRFGAAGDLGEMASAAAKGLVLGAAVEVADPAAARAGLEAGLVPFEETRDGTHVPPSHASGLALSFVRA